MNIQLLEMMFMKSLGFYLACSEPQELRAIIISFVVIATLWGTQSVCLVLDVLFMVAKFPI